MADRNSPFASKLRGLRAERDLSQADLASLVGTSLTSVQNWENGVTMPTLRVSIRIADVLKVSLDQLVGRDSLSVA